MNDLWLGAIWMGVLGAAVGAAVLAHVRGLSSTYVRDGLHIGAGVWVLGWPLWHDPATPIAITSVAWIVVGMVPLAAHRLRFAARFFGSVTGNDERYRGLVVYTLSYLVLTAVGLVGSPFPAAAALWVLSLGDGIGGAVGRRFGRHRFRTRLGKTKSVEGSLAVAAAAAAAVLAAAALFDVTVHAWQVAVLALVAAVTEALAPRSSDNALLPAAVWITASLVT